MDCDTIHERVRQYNIRDPDESMFRLHRNWNLMRRDRCVECMGCLSRFWDGIARNRIHGNIGRIEERVLWRAGNDGRRLVYSERNDHSNGNPMLWELWISGNHVSEYELDAHNQFQPINHAFL